MPLILAGTLAVYAGLALGLSDAGTWGALLALGLVPWRLGSIGRGAPLALALAGASLVGEATRLRDERCVDVLLLAPQWTATIGLKAAEPGAGVRASVEAFGCRTDALVMVSRGQAPPGGRVRVRGTATPSDRGLAIVNAHLGPAEGRDLMLALRARAAQRLDALLGPHAPMARALLVADTRDLSLELKDRFADAGLIHAVSISGLHVSIVAAALVLVFGALRASPTVATLAALAATAAYIVLLGAPPPAVRSAVMLAAQGAAKLLQRPTSRWAMLAWGALIPLLLDAHAALDIGYQLSVSGMVALSCAGSFAQRTLTGRFEGWRDHVAKGLVTGSAVTALTAPLVAWHLGRLSLVAPITNLIADPLLAVLQPALFVVLALGGTDAPAALAAAGATPLLAAFDGIARMGAAIPGAAVAISPTPLTAILTGGAALAFGMACLATHPSRWVIGGLGSLALLVWLPASSGSGLTELHVIDVGQGDALALRSPKGRWVLIDAGPAFGKSDAGRTVVAPYLRRLGGDVVAMIITHPDADHVGGAASVLRATRPTMLLDPAFAGTSSIYRAMLDESRRDGVGWRAARTGDSLVVDGMTVFVLAPDSAWMAGAQSPNDGSVVVMVRVGEVRMLLTGDAEAPEEAWLVERWGADALKADVLKVGHHGSSTSTTPALLAAVQPRVALVSVGEGNHYHHPSPQVMESLARAGAQVLRTDRLGTLVLRTDGTRLTVRTGAGDWAINRAR